MLYLEFCLFISRGPFRGGYHSLEQISKGYAFVLPLYITFQELAYGGSLPILFIF